MSVLWNYTLRNHFLEDGLCKIYPHTHSHWLILGVTLLFEVNWLPIDVVLQG